jgi:PAS domain-containing protein
MNNDWFEEAPLAVTVCDPEGVIIGMNDGAARSFASSGGRGLVGTNVLDCHPEPARSKLKAMLEEQRTNVYTVRKEGRKKLIFQSPWRREGRYAGFLELSLEIPEDLPHFDRDEPCPPPTADGT